MVLDGYSVLEGYSVLGLYVSDSNACVCCCCCSFGLSQTKAPAPSTALKSLACRAPSYTEGINHELENVFINDEWERDDLKVLCRLPLYLSPALSAGALCVTLPEIFSPEPIYSLI